MRALLLKVAGISLLVLGIAGALAWGVFKAVGFFKAIDDFDRVGVPGSRIVELDEDHYTVFVEALPLPSSDKSFPIPPIRLRVSPLDNPGTAVPAKEYGSNFTYSLGSKHGRGFKTFDIEQKGPYRVTATSSTETAAGTYIIAFGKPVSRFIWRGIVGCLVLFFGLGTAGVLLLTYSDRWGRQPFSS